MAEIETINGNPIVADIASESITPVVDAWLTAHPEATATVADGAITTVKIADDAVTDAKLAQAGVKSIVRRYGTFESYLYKRNTYINNSGAEATVNGYDTYKIPVSANDLLHIVWTGNFWYNLNPAYCLKLEKSDGTFENLSMLQDGGWFYISNNIKEGIFAFPEGYRFFVLTCYRDYSDMIIVDVNGHGSVLDDTAVRLRQTVTSIDRQSAFETKYYFTNSGGIMTLSGNYKALLMPVHAGDKVTFSSLVLSYYATFRSASSGTTVNVTTASYVAGEDGVLSVFEPLDGTSNAMLVAADSVKIDASNIIDTAISSFAGLTWASFGDSITYRASWQPYVVGVLGMSHVNCGIGSTSLSGNSANAFWRTERLDAVKAANPDIVTILGGANDLVMNPVIGTEANLSDKDTSTFIGAYSYIIDNLLTWKPSLRIFILSTTWAHNDGASYSQTVTYGQFAEACKLVAEYYKLPFVDLYSNSGFNSYTMGASPNNIYSDDSIHPNDAGGRVIASQVIAKMQEVMLIH